MIQGRTRSEHEKEINERKLEPINQVLSNSETMERILCGLSVSFFFLRQALWPLLDSISNHAVRKARVECLLSTGFLWLFLWVAHGRTQKLLCFRVSASQGLPQHKTPIHFPTFSVDSGSNDDYELILIFGNPFSLIIHSHRIVASMIISVWQFWQKQNPILWCSGFWTTENHIATLVDSMWTDKLYLVHIDI